MSRIVGLGDYGSSGAGGGGGGHDRRPGDPNEYYVGGAGRNGGSGQSVVGPGGRRGAGGVEGIFNAAQSSSPGNEHQGPAGHVTITFYRNGFVIDDGKLRSVDDPESQAFIEEMNKGYCPKELQMNGMVPMIHPVDKRGEDYSPPPPPAYVAFSGGGQTLGASSSSSSSSSYSGSSGGTDLFTPDPSNAAEPTVDAAQPTTRIQIRTASGSRIVGKFNRTHTIEDLQRFIDAKAPVSGQYKLMEGRPPKPILGSKKTLADAGLLNVAISQQLA